jgi:hypothetical protein
VVAHEQTHLVLGDGLQLLQGSLHYLVQRLLDLAALAVDLLELGLGCGHLRHQRFLLLVQRGVHLLQEAGSLTVLLSDSDKVVHEHFARTVITFDLAVDADGPIALQAEKFQLDGRVKQAVANYLRLLRQLCSLMLMLQFVVVVGLVA